MSNEFYEIRYVAAYSTDRITNHVELYLSIPP